MIGTSILPRKTKYLEFKSFAMSQKEGSMIWKRNASLLKLKTGLDYVLRPA
jgi:hypothetical protein